MSVIPSRKHVRHRVATDATVPSRARFGRFRHAERRCAGAPSPVEVHVSNGLPGFTIVGLPDAAVRESRDRVRAALLSSGLPWPLRRVTVNLAPSGVRKGGAGLDLADRRRPPRRRGRAAARLHRRPRLLRRARAQRLAAPRPGHDRPGRRRCRTARASWCRCATCGRPHWCAVSDAHGAATLADLVRDAARPGAAGPASRRPPPRQQRRPTPPDLADVRGQALGRQALEVAAAGRHHLLMVGPPGSGKTMLAERLRRAAPAAHARPRRSR